VRIRIHDKSVVFTSLFFSLDPEYGFRIRIIKAIESGSNPDPERLTINFAAVRGVSAFYLYFRFVEMMACRNPTYLAQKNY
jgi:hypothetical protein